MSLSVGMFVKEKPSFCRILEKTVEGGLIRVKPQDQVMPINFDCNRINAMVNCYKKYSMGRSFGGPPKKILKEKGCYKLDCELNGNSDKCPFLLEQ